MRWRPGLGQWSSIEEPPEWRSVSLPEASSPVVVSREAKRRPSMFDAFRPTPEEGRRESGPRPSMFRAFAPATIEPERRSPAPRPERREASRPSMFAAFKAEDAPAGDMWTDMFGSPVAPRAAAAAPEGLVFRSSMSGAGTDSGKGFSWGLAAAVLGLGTILVLEASGVTNVFGTRRTT